MNDDFLMAKLQEAFRAEARERLESLIKLAESLEVTPHDSKELGEILEKAYREAHSLKGAARAVGFEDVENLCQALESVIFALKKGEKKVTSDVVDALFETANLVEKKISGAADSKEFNKLAAHLQNLLEEEGSDEPSEKPITEENEAASEEPIEPVTISSVDAPPVTGDTVRVKTEALDALMRRVEELLPLYLRFSNQFSRLKSLSIVLENLEEELALGMKGGVAWFVGSDNKGEEGTITVTPAKLAEAISIAKEVVSDVDSIRTQFSLLVSELLEGAKELLLQPFSTITTPMKKMIRDVARELGKKVRILIEGDSIEVDRRILEELRSPIMHILRNAIDHGIETPEERVALGKDQLGNVHIRVLRKEADKVEIVIEDDGAGIRADRIRSELIRRGVVGQDKAASLRSTELMEYIFSPDFSTSPTITKLSGRGVGMAIVKEVVDRLGGRVSIDSREGQGTKISLELPVTLATFRGILISECDRFFMIPTHQVDAVLKVDQQDFQTVGGKETMVCAGRVIGVVRLSHLLNLNKQPEGSFNPDRKYLTVLIIRAGNLQAGVIVDKIITEHEALVKDLGPHLKKVPFIWGATILGTGEVVPILNPYDLINATRVGTFGTTSNVRETKVTNGPSDYKPRILVVEDSFTSRLLMKNILEAAGYYVEDTTDGVEALSSLRRGDFDLVVSDVEMPRMNGFELTRAIREDEQLKHIPVILVTGLESPEDKERGLDAGADAYIVKSSFNLKELLDTIKKFI
ncbi:MAG: response regulator [Deltaproteobacteria bacterium]|nr:response regulator [Deltaproteobacteria bacterium]